MSNDKTEITFAVHLFVQYMWPNGGLNQHRETHALFYYYLLAKNAYDTMQAGMIAYEGDADSGFNFEQLFKSVARMYGVEPEAMVKCWDLVDYTCFLNDLPKLPDETKYRQNHKPIEIWTH